MKEPKKKKIALRTVRRRIDIRAIPEDKAVKILSSAGVGGQTFNMTLQGAAASRFLYQLAKVVGEAFDEPISLFIDGKLIDVAALASQPDEGLTELW